MGFRPACPACSLIQEPPDDGRCEACGAQLYPTDSEPGAELERFVVGNVTGYPISRGGVNSSHHPATLWYVYDRAHGYRAVREFRGNGYRRATTEQAARDHAERLNGELR